MDDEDGDLDGDNDGLDAVTAVEDVVGGEVVVITVSVKASPLVEGLTEVDSVSGNFVDVTSSGPGPVLVAAW